MVIQLNLDLTKIDKTKIKPFTRKNGDKGQGYDVVIFLNDEPDEHGNYGFAATSTGKDEPRGNILGNVKIAGKKNEAPSSNRGSVQKPSDEDDLPF
jgi:hypothetical protein